MRIHIHHTWGEPDWLCGLERKIDLILESAELLLQQQERIMATFDDLTAQLTAISAVVPTIKTDVETLLAKLAAVPPAGLTPEQQAALDSAVQTAQGIATSLGAIDAEVNPPPAAT